METRVVSCRTIQLEVEKALCETGLDFPVSWVESGLHNYPQKLRDKLQEILDRISADRVLLAMGFCGNALAGLNARDFELVFPRADDCITLLLGSPEERKRYGRTYFLSKGWLQGERNIYEEYKYALHKYGPEQGGAIFRMMLGHYEYLGILDTGVCDFDALAAQAGAIADELDLTLRTIPAKDRFLKELLKGPWPEERFCVVAPNTAVGGDMLML